MSEPWARVAVVAGALALAGMIVVWRRIRSRRAARDVPTGSLEPGIYLFTSSSCPTCESARDRLRRQVGEEGFEELSWESHPDIFIDSGVDAVPALVVVRSSGLARLYPGASERAVALL